MTLEEAIEIARPHNDRIIAEGRLAEAEQKIERLYGQIFDLKSALGGMVALMQLDLDDGRAPLTPTRIELITKAREISRGGYGD